MSLRVHSSKAAWVTAGLAIVGAVACFGVGGCDNSALPLTWKTPPEPGPETPEGFARLWGANCAGCHGADGAHGPARPMRDAVYLATVSDAELHRVISGGSARGTMMPAFGHGSGGSLSDEEVSAVVAGMRRAWGRPEAMASSIPYAAPATRGDPDRGKAAFERTCAACHAPEGPAIPGAIAAGSITDPFFLQLVSDQALRSAILFGRFDLGMPGASGPYPGRDPSERLTAQDVDDIVAWLAQRRASDWPPRSIRRGGEP